MLFPFMLITLLDFVFLRTRQKNQISIQTGEKGKEETGCVMQWGYWYAPTCLTEHIYVMMNHSFPDGSGLTWEDPVPILMAYGLTE